MWRKIGLYCLEGLGIGLGLTVLEFLHALPGRQFFPWMVISLVILVDLVKSLSKIDKKLETLAKRLNVSLEDAPAEEKKRIIVSD